MIRAAPALRVAIYTRVSTAGQEEEGTSLLTQEQRCRAYAAEHGYAVVGVYSDTHSGAELRERRQLAALRDLVATGGADVVLAYALDRLSRNQAHVYILADECERHGARLEFVTENFEDSAVGRFIRSAKAFAAEVEREKIGERMLRGKRARAAAGQWLPGAKPRYGYHYTAARTAFLIYEPEAVIVRRIFARAVEGISCRQIALALTRDAVPTPNGRTVWTSTGVLRILTNRQYLGEAVAFAATRRLVRSASGARYLREFPTPPEQRIALPAGTIPPLIDAATFAAAQQTVAHGKALAYRNNARPYDALLRGGFVRCGYCGSVMQVNSYARQPRYQCVANGVAPGRCAGQPSIGIGELDAAVWDRIRALLTQPELLREELAGRAAVPPPVAELARLRTASAELGRQQTNLVTNLAVVPAEAAPAIGAKLAELARQQQALAAELADLERQQTRAQAQQAELASLDRWCQQLGTRLDGAPSSLRQQILLTLGVRARVWRASDARRYELSVTLGCESPGKTADAQPGPVTLTWWSGGSAEA